jgi:cytochrome c peroxidase
VEMAGFTGITENPGPFGPRHFQFDDGRGQPLPAPDATGVHNFPIQAAVDARLNAIPAYLEKFGEVFNGGVPLPAGGITISMRRRAIAEFQTSLTAANAPLDQFARGERGAMTQGQKRGALLFFGEARCVHCHAVAGPSNEMFSDFAPHRIGGPQVAPVFGVGTGNTLFDGPGENEDFGFEQTEGDPALRYTFRTAPLRNLKVAPAFFHNGAFGTPEAAIAHHLDVKHSLLHYDPRDHNVPPDLSEGPFEGILNAGIDPLLRRPIRLSGQEFRDLVEFVQDALFDERVVRFCERLPASVPSGLPLQLFEGCE